jgi:hypothetical protein
MMAHIRGFLMQLCYEVEYAVVLRSIPRVAGIQLVAENKSQAVIFFHRCGCFLEDIFIYK